MWSRFLNRFFFTVAAVIWMSSLAAAETLRPFVLGDTPPGDLKQVTEAVKSKLTMQGFEIVGSYSPLGESGAGPVPRARYRIALNFPDTKMAGAHGFTKIMTAPWGIRLALEAVAGFRREQ